MTNLDNESGKKLQALILAVILTHCLRHSLKGYWTVGHWPCCQCGRRHFTLSTTIHYPRFSHILRKKTMNNRLPSSFQLSLPHVPPPSCGGDLAFAACLGFQFAGHRLECSKLTPPPSNFFGPSGPATPLCQYEASHIQRTRRCHHLIELCVMIHGSSLSPPQGTPVSISRNGFRAPLSGA